VWTTKVGRSKNIHRNIQKRQAKNLIKVKATKNEALIYFSDAMKEIIANNHNNGVRVPKREFFGIGKDDEKIVNKEYRKLLDKKIRAWENAK